MEELNTLTLDGVSYKITDTAALPASGGTMAGPIDMGGHKMTGLPMPAADGDAASKIYANLCFGRKGTRIDVSEGASILDEIGDNGGYRLSQELTICDSSVAHLLHFNTFDTADIDSCRCALQIGLGFTSTPTMVVRWRWYYTWSEWKKL